MSENKEVGNFPISPDEQALQALKIIAGKLGEVAGSLKNEILGSYIVTLVTNKSKTPKDHKK